jgi:IclR family transcriptional regulator, KDG regulon repressor
VTTASKPNNAPSLQVLERTFAVLDCFVADHPEWTTTELAQKVDLPIATAHRILRVLLARGYLARDPHTKRFRLGPAAMRLGTIAREGLDLRRAARPVLVELVRSSDETALLTVLDDPPEAGLCVERVETSQRLRLSIERGSRTPLHAGASQKAILAYLPAEELELLLTRPHERLSEHTVTDPVKLRADVEGIRARGWAISYGENDVGAWGLAVPIMDHADHVIASVGLAGPSARLTRASITRHLRNLKVAARSLSKVLGVKPIQLDTSADAIKATGVLESLGLDSPPPKRTRAPARA